MGDTAHQRSARRLDLNAVGVVDPLHWRWVLSDPGTGRQLAEHTVALDRRRWEVEALTDLHAYLDWRMEPDRRVASAAEVVIRLGEFIAREVLGPAVMAELGGQAPVRLRMGVAEAAFLTAFPLELAYLDGVPLARSGRVRMSFTVTAGSTRAPVQPEAVRLLAVFSLPTGTTALRLRSERQQLADLIRRLERPVELEILQWGVTRETLADRMARNGGPDLLHLAGHGRQSGLVLECPDGAPDEIDASSLVDLLRPARRRLRLVFVSACESAAAPPRWVELDRPGPRVTDLTAVPASLGVRLARELDCTVLAMRYPVTDDVAGDLADTFYTGLIGSGSDVGTAVAQAVRKVAEAGASAARPAMSLAAPVLIGPDDVTVVRTDMLTAQAITKPDAAGPLAGPISPMVGSPPAAPDRFVGREHVMTVAGAALQPASGIPIIVLTGMAAVGKTTCAAELAHQHRGNFDKVVFWSAPERDADQQDTVAAFFDAVDHGLGDAVPSPADAQQGWAEAAAELLDRCDRRRTLLVLDNAESLLTADGRWRDQRWSDLLTVLAAHLGLTRLLVTSQVPPAAPTGDGVLQLSVEPLSDSEARVLARQLPNLRRLLHIDEPADRPGSDGSTSADERRYHLDRTLVNAALAAAQGHPKLLELADATAVDSAELSRLLQVTGQPATGAQWLGETLIRWTQETTRRLDPAALLMVQILAAVEPAHRFPGTLRAAWADVWEKLGRLGAAPPGDAMLSVLVAAALTQRRTLSGTSVPAGVDVAGATGVIRYELHPTVAATIRADTPADVGTVVNLVLADAWQQIATMQEDRRDQESTSVAVGAFLAAVPYLLRQSSHARAAACLSAALVRDNSPRTARIALPYAAALDPATTSGRDVVVATALQPLDPVEAERLLRQAVSAPDEEVASTAAGTLANQLHQQGRLTEALELAERHEQLIQRKGPWTRAGARVRRLQVVHESGQAERALDGVTKILDELRTLSKEATAPDGPPESVVPWTVWEAALSLAVSAALTLERWQVALDHNQLLLDSVQRRGAPEADVAFFWFNDAHALIPLGRLDEARKVLTYCQRVFDEYGAELSLSRAVGTRALLAAKQGHWTEAVALEQTALRLGYRHPLAADLAAGHQLLGNHLGKLGTDPAGQLAHHLAAALLTRITGSALLPRFLHTLATDLHTYGQSWLPEDMAALAARVQRVDGVRFLDLVHTLLTPDPAEQVSMSRNADPAGHWRDRAEEQFRRLLADVRRTAAEQGFDVTGNLLRWEGLMPLIAVAAAGHTQAHSQLTAILQPTPPGTDAKHLAEAIRRVAAGERDDLALIARLHPADAAVIRRALETIHWREKVQGCVEEEQLALIETDYLAAVDAEDHVRAGLRAAELAGLLRARDEFTAALRYADQAIAHRRRAGFGPWSQRFDLGRRLQLLDDLRRWEELLAELAPIRDELRGEPDLPSRTDPTNPSTTRENLLTLGLRAAAALREWESALDFHDDLAASMRMRGASTAELALHQLDRIPILSPLRRDAEIGSVLDEVRRVLAGDLDPATRAQFDTRLTRAGEALKPDAPWRLQALADAYEWADGEDVNIPLIAHEHLLFAIGFGPAKPSTNTLQASHLLASAIVLSLTGENDRADRSIRIAAPHLYQPDGTRATATLDSIVAEVEQVPGVRFQELVTQVIGTPHQAAEAVIDTVHTAYRIPVAELFDLDQAVADQETAIAAVTAAHTGGPRQRTACEPVLAELAAKPDFAPLAAAFRRAADGNLPSRDEQQAMHPIHAAIIDALRSRIESLDREQ